MREAGWDRRVDAASKLRGVGEVLDGMAEMEGLRLLHCLPCRSVWAGFFFTPLPLHEVFVGFLPLIS